MRRKTQVEKFNARFGKNWADEQAIKEGEIKNSKPEVKAEKLVKANGIDPEEIFAIVTRENIGLMNKLWNNSMENVIKETIKNEVKELVRETIREELLSAYKGILKGMNNELIKNSEPLKEIEIAKREVATTVAKKYTVTKNKDELIANIIKAKNEGINPSVGKTFKSLSGRHNGLYQRFMTENKGIKGAWKNFVQDVLNEN